MIKEYLEKIADKLDDKNKQEMERENSAPCKACGSKEFIQLFRNVVGEISGRMQGFFSLFGGSISGSIDGYTKTLPVLSCKNCHNEREVATWQYTHERDLFWSEMHYFYFGVSDDRPEKFKELKSIYLENPLDTKKFMENNYNYDFKFYNEIPNWLPETWAKAGFKINKVKKRHFIFWTKEVYPTWEELEIK